jgi:hypothetical protein
MRNYLKICISIILFITQHIYAFQEIKALYDEDSNTIYYEGNIFLISIDNKLKLLETNMATPEVETNDSSGTFWFNVTVVLCTKYYNITFIRSYNFCRAYVRFDSRIPVN